MKLYLVLLSLFFSHFLNSQCIKVSAKAGTLLNDNSIGSVPWTNLNGANNSDDNYSSATALLFGQTTNYLIASNFNFSIPNDALICGIEIKVEGHSSSFMKTVKDNSIRIIKNGKITGNNAANGINWSSSDGLVFYGDSSSAWGETWTVVDLNSSDFGIAISMRLDGSLILPSVSIDEIEMSVYYDSSIGSPLPVELIDFWAEEMPSNGVELNWITESEINNDFFLLMSSVDGAEWHEEAIVQGNGNSNIRRQYSKKIFKNPFNNASLYFKLMQFDFNGDQYDYPPIKFDYHIDSKTKIFPNPCKRRTRIKAKENIRSVKLLDSFQKTVKEWELYNVDIELDLDGVIPAIYFVEMVYENGVRELSKLIVE